MSNNKKYYAFNHQIILDDRKCNHLHANSFEAILALKV